MDHQASAPLDPVPVRLLLLEKGLDARAVEAALGPLPCIRGLDGALRTLEALARRSVRLPDVLLLAVTAYHRQADQLLAALKASEQLAHLPVVVILPSAALSDRVRAARRGAVATAEPSEVAAALARLGRDG